jgi:hypothetical protein
MIARTSGNGQSMARTLLLGCFSSWIILEFLDMPLAWRANGMAQRRERSERPLQPVLGSKGDTYYMLANAENTIRQSPAA